MKNKNLTGSGMFMKLHKKWENDTFAFAANTYKRKRHGKHEKGKVPFGIQGVDPNVNDELEKET